MSLGMRLMSLAVVLLLVACSDPASPATTGSGAEPGSVEDVATLWGFTPFPSAPTNSAVGTVFEFVAAEGDLIAHHFDGAIPWSHLLEGAPLPAELASELEGRASFDAANPELVVYVATALTNLERTGVPDASTGDTVPDYADSFSSPEVGEALMGWVDLLVDTFDPTYLNVGVELDMYAANRPDDWDNLFGLYQDIYGHVKETHPDTVVFASFQAELGDPDVFDDVTRFSDAVGISTYPYLAADGIPDAEYLDRFASAGLPMLIAETGYPAGEVTSPRGTVDSDAQTQAAYVAWLGERAAEQDLGFVVWFLPFDIEAFLSEPGTPASAAAFARLGLANADGKARPSLEQWRRNRSGD
jgi:hypothetical protein